MVPHWACHIELLVNCQRKCYGINWTVVFIRSNQYSADATSKTVHLYTVMSIDPQNLCQQFVQYVYSLDSAIDEQ